MTNLICIFLAIVCCALWDENSRLREHVLRLHDQQPVCGRVVTCG